MIIKSFTAESAAAALKHVRSQMGGDAVVLKTRQVVDELGRPAVEVTACIDRPSVAQTSRILNDRGRRVTAAIESSIPTTVERKRAASVTEPAAESVAPPPAHHAPVADAARIEELESKLTRLIEASSEATIAHINGTLESLASSSRPAGGDERLTRLHMMLADADVPDAFATAFLATLSFTEDNHVSPFERARRALTESLAEMMEPSVALQPGDTAIVFGPSGAGKTAVIGKLAAHLIGREKKKVRLVTLDDVKIGAHDEIVSYAAILGVELTDPTGTNEKLAHYADCVTLIDTPGLPVDQTQFTEFAERVSKVGATHRIAVFSCLTRSSDITDIAERIRGMQPTHVVMSMLDVTSRRGAVIAACEATGAKMAWLAESPAGVGTIHAPDPSKIASTLMSVEDSHE